MTAKRSTTRKPKDAVGGLPEKPATGPRFIELVNWKRAQPKMSGANNPWMKLYTSLLDHDGFDALDDASRLLLIGLWLYAARSGRHVFPADPRWIWKRIPMLNSKPDLKPLLEARDSYGRPTPFLQYCEPAVAAAAEEAAPAQPARKAKAQNSQVGSGSADESRAEKRRADETLRVSEKKEREKKRVSSRSSAHRASQPAEQSPAEQGRAAQTTAEQTAPQQTTKDQGTAQHSEKPENPSESEAAGPKGPPAAQGDQPQARRSACRHEPRTLGSIPIWWSDPNCVAFSYRIFQELGLRMDPEGQAGKAERGTFASWLFHARANTPMSRWAWLEEKAVAKAQEIRKYGKSARSPGAVWLKVMSKEIEARAGPASAAAVQQMA